MRILGLATLLSLGACGDNDGGGNPSDQLLVGAECATAKDCLQSNVDGGFSEQCLTQFKGGYCGIENCTALDDCPLGSACVAHTDGNNYCFRLCIDKPECNVNRTPDNESNCSANVDYLGANKDDVGKACVPPSG